MQVRVIGSGSKGNSYILSSPTDTLIIEAGLPVTEIMKGLDYNLSKVKGCLVSHNHKDHSKAIKDLVGLGVEVYASKDTFEVEGVANHHRANKLTPLKQLSIGDYIIIPFETEHDCDGSLGFLIRYEPTAENILFITDSYYSRYKFKNVDYVMIECNYVKETLDYNIEKEYIDWRLKNRLLKSHFSLENLIKFFKANDQGRYKKIILLHLSSSNSDASKMIDEVESATGIHPYIAEKGLVVDFK